MNILKLTHFSENNIIRFNSEAFYFFLKIYCFILCVCARVCVYVRPFVSGHVFVECSCSGRPEASGLLEQESQMVVSHSTWVLGPRLGSLESTTRSQSLSHLCSLQGPYFKRLHFDGDAELIRMRHFSVICFVGNLGESMPFLLLCSGFGSQPP